MNHQLRLFSIIIILLLSAILHANPALTNIAGLESNIVTLTNSNQSDSQLYISSLTSTFTAIPKIALAITGLSGSNSNLDSSFHIAPQTITISSFIISWQRNTQKWQRVDLKFMATTRDDLIIGTSQATYNGESNKIKIDMNEIANFNASILRTFLLGCDTGSSSLKCGLLPSGVAQNSFSIEVENMAVNSKISFSYVIFAPSIAKFTSYGGLVNKEAFKGSLNAKVFKTIAYSDHKFHGLSYIKLTGEIATNFNSKIDSGFAFSLNSQQLINTLSIFYIVIGRTAKNSCTDLNNALQLKTQCLSVCPDNTYIYSYSDGGKSCQSCSQVFNLTLSDGKCVLINKTTQVIPSKTSDSLNNLIPLFKQAENKQIKTISQSSIPQDRSSQQIVQQAVASQSSSNQQQTSQQSYTNTVDSSASSSYSSISSSNIPIVPIVSSIPIQQPQNQQSYTQTNDNSGIYVTQATAASSSVLINPQNIPITTCGSYQFFLNGICVCQVGYQRVGGICMGFSSQSEQTAIQSKITDKSSIISTPTFSNTVPQPVFCGEGYDNGFGVCVCSNGMTYDQGRCYPIQQQLQYEPQHEIAKEEPTIQCGRNQKFDKEKYSCLCKKGYGRLNGACVLCPDKMVINQDGFCVEDFREKKEEKKTQVIQNGHKKQDDNNFVKVQPASQLNSSISLQKKQKDCQNITVNATIPTQPQPQAPKQQKIPPPPKSDDNKNPSTLIKNTNSTIKSSSDDTKTSANLKLSGSMKGNNNQIFMTLDSITPFDFPDQQTMSNFLKAKFTGCSSPTLFCNQQVKTKNLFDCLLLFPSGVPNQSFTVEYSYSYQGNEGYSKISVDPLKIQSSNSRSNSRVSNNVRAS